MFQIDTDQIRALEAEAEPGFVVCLPSGEASWRATELYVNRLLNDTPELLDELDRLRAVLMMTTDTAKRRLDELRKTRDERDLAMDILARRNEADKDRDPFKRADHTFEVSDYQCPNCGERGTIFGYMLNQPDGTHMHTKYACRSWPEKGVMPCGWTGWTVPGWEWEKN